MVWKESVTQQMMISAMQERCTMFKEFREFISKGNMIDLAVGLVLGAAFGAVINSFVKDILMPPIGMALGKVDFGNLFISLNGEAYKSMADATKAGAPTINYGAFINQIINLLIVGFALFIVVKAVNKLRRAPEDPTSKECPFCVSEISINATRCPNCTSELPATN